MLEKHLIPKFVTRGDRSLDHDRQKSVSNHRIIAAKSHVAPTQTSCNESNSRGNVIVAALSIVRQQWGEDMELAAMNILAQGNHSR